VYKLSFIVAVYKAPHGFKLRLHGKEGEKNVTGASKQLTRSTYG